MMFDHHTTNQRVDIYSNGPDRIELFPFFRKVITDGHYLHRLIIIIFSAYPISTYIHACVGCMCIMHVYPYTQPSVVQTVRRGLSIQYYLAGRLSGPVYR